MGATSKLRHRITRVEGRRQVVQDHPLKVENPQQKKKKMILNRNKA